jgi:hypothetical protein
MVIRYLKYFFRFGYLIGIAAMIAMLPFSKYVLSVAEFTVAGAWIADRIDLEKFNRFIGRNTRLRLFLTSVPYFLYLVLEGIGKGVLAFLRNRPALIFTSLFLLHVVGLVYTVDFDYALKDLRTKLPLLFLPLIFSTSKPVTRREFHGFMLLFVVAVVIASVMNAYNLFINNYIDIRDISRHISHVVFALFACLSLFMLAYFAAKKTSFPLMVRILFLLVMIWIGVYLVLSQSLTGISVFIGTAVILALVILFRQESIKLKTGSVIVLVILTFGTIFYVRHVVHDFYTVNPENFNRPDPFTPRGKPYATKLWNTQTENGNYVWVYVQWDELRESWNQRSRISFDSLDMKGQRVCFTLIRFLASKGYRKDADGVNQLTPEEVKGIEKGIANVIFMKEFSIRGRIYELLWGYEEYRKTGNPTGNTMMQRLEFWKASVGLIKDNFWIGVGTGDMNEAFDEQYRKMDTKLAPDQRWRSHNQFLSIFVAFGIFGFILFLFAMFYPPSVLKYWDDFFFLAFMIISLISMLTEDTIESQAGVTFFAFFYCFFLFTRKEKQEF